MSVPLDRLPDAPRIAWTRLRDELLELLGDQLVAIWAYGGTTSVDTPPRPDPELDTYVIVHRRIDESTGRAIDAIEAAIAADTGVEWDNWYVPEADERRADPPRHAYRPDRRDTTWAVTRAHFLAGRYALIHGPDPADVVPPPTWPELEADLDREVEHIERHVAEGDTDPYEATYAILNGSRILRALETRDVAISKREAGEWALAHLADRWHPVVNAALRAYERHATPDDPDLLAREMAAFVAMVRDRLPTSGPHVDGRQPRWSGY
jgi:hypothetical protein